MPNHDASPPSLDFHLVANDSQWEIGQNWSENYYRHIGIGLRLKEAILNPAQKEKLFHGLISSREVKGEVAWLAVGTLQRCYIILFVCSVYLTNTLFFAFVCLLC